MADESTSTDKPASAKGAKKLLLIGVIALMSIVIASVVGGMMGSRMGGAAPAQAQTSKPGAEEKETEPAAEGEKGGHGGGHGKEGEKEPALKEGEMGYYDGLEPVTVNLDEPRLGRYVRATIVLAIEGKQFKSASEVLTKRKAELKSWLTVYLAGCTVEDVRGPQNLNRIRNEIKDSFNEQLWPDKKPLIAKVLFKEFAVQ